MKTQGSARYGGIEAGGTKFICAVGTGPDEVEEVIRFPTTTPGETLARAIGFFEEQHRSGPLQGVGLASFGPLELDPRSPQFGYLTKTPKPGWSNTDLLGTLRAGLNLPIGIDTDVNGAALAESLWGAGQGLESLVYLTIGTGIGGGAIVNGKLVHGLLHPEMGHMRIPHDLETDPYPGACPFHADCLEGLATGPALAARWNADPSALPPDHRAWNLEAHYIGLALVNLIVVMSPERIILGGGVMDQAHLFPKIRNEVQRLLNDYVQRRQVDAEIDSYIVPPALGERVGVLGAFALAAEAAR